MKRGAFSLIYSFLKDHNTANIKTLSGFKAIVFVEVKTSSFASNEAASIENRWPRRKFRAPSYCYRRFESLKNLTTYPPIPTLSRWQGALFA
ncbi:hypothetical protein AVEN_4558-1 [Araneus ventricosus]|uniref:Uncharacterized protein n=1 Tax=Araneus ventricosus TaxID=182803 RepID=A0A4Y2BLB0_ARAVE|nr:hypothetical protein AVEN_4558-1 [Araneus ventricosus]